MQDAYDTVEVFFHRDPVKEITSNDFEEEVKAQLKQKQNPDKYCSQITDERDSHALAHKLRETEKEHADLGCGVRPSSQGNETIKNFPCPPVLWVGILDVCHVANIE